ncbi:MAG: PAS domain S-box protein [Anaerolineaceae bacterium]|nr:PAS domain S-box protein [Anaerolineaceae bacterium]
MQIDIDKNMLQEGDRWFEECFDAIYQFMGILDTQGKVIRANRAALELTGLTHSNIVGIPLWTVPWPGLAGRNRLILKRAVNQANRGRFVRSELEIRYRKQPEMIIDFSIKPILNEAGLVKFMIAEGRDITVYKHTSDALYQSEARFRTIYEEAGIGIVIKGIDGRMLDCNTAFQSMLGYSSGDLVQRNYLDITHPLDKGISRKLFNELVAGKRKSYFVEKRYIHKDGQIVWGRITTSLVRGQDGRPRFVIGMVENITENKQIEAELNELQQRLMQGREMERLRMAQDIHDGPLQEIIGVSYQIKELESVIKEDALSEQLRSEQLQAIRTNLQQLTNSVRAICGELRPPTLVPFGLEKTILSHVEDFQEAHPDMTINLDLVKDGQNLPEQIRLVLFRIYQESLNNILHHAQAKTIGITFKLVEDKAVLEVQDDGIGFVLPSRWVKLARQGHLGLVGAMERAKDVGGEFEVVTAPGQGTLIRAIVPIKEELSQVR